MAETPANTIIRLAKASAVILIVLDVNVTNTLSASIQGSDFFGNLGLGVQIAVIILTAILIYSLIYALILIIFVQIRYGVHIILKPAIRAIIFTERVTIQPTKLQTGEE